MSPRTRRERSKRTEVTRTMVTAWANYSVDMFFIFTFPLSLIPLWSCLLLYSLNVLPFLLFLSPLLLMAGKDTIILRGQGLPF